MLNQKGRSISLAEEAESKKKIKKSDSGEKKLGVRGQINAVHSYIVYANAPEPFRSLTLVLLLLFIYIYFFITCWEFLNWSSSVVACFSSYVV